jgi:2-polyprenyl-3-methyl-5-hydroxy-6-metoxy-1,4-benzoquinol methylase
MPTSTSTVTGTSFCPRCFTTVAEGQRECAKCRLAFDRVGGILDTIGAKERETRAAGVEEFYTASPFPGYHPGDDGPTLIDRSRQAPFLVALDGAIGPETTVVDCGCGTGQLASFLALSGPRRRVIGVDGCKESLMCADWFRGKAGIRNIQLVRGDLFDLPLEERQFQVVISRGVVHHTPDPDRAIECVAKRVAPGGFLLLGYYETMGRFLHCARRVLGRVVGKPIRFLDPILRRKDLDEEKKRIWIEDQYLHPLEHILPTPHVVKLLEGLGFSWVRSVPPAADGSKLFESVPKPGWFGMFSMRMGWLLRGLNDPDAGLVFVIMKRSEK